MMVVASSVLPPKEDTGGTEHLGFRCPRRFVARLEEMEGDTDYTRSELLVRAVQLLIEAYDAEQRKKKGSR